MIAGSDRRAYPQLSDPRALQNQAYRMHRDSVNGAQQPPRNRGGLRSIKIPTIGEAPAAPQPILENVRRELGFVPNVQRLDADQPSCTGGSGSARLSRPP
jgi:hypothetical protein